MLRSILLLTMFPLLIGCGAPTEPCADYCDGNQYFSCELNEFQTCRDCSLEDQAPTCSPPTRVFEGNVITQATSPRTRGFRFPYDIPFEGLGILLIADDEVVDYTVTDSTGFYRLSSDHRGDLQLIAEAHSPFVYASVVDCARASEAPCDRNFYTHEIANVDSASADPIPPTSSTWTAYEDVTILETFDFTLRNNYYLPFIGLQRLIVLHQFLEREFAYSTRSLMYYADGVEIECDSICTYTQPRPAPDVIVAQSFWGGAPKDVFAIAIFTMTVMAREKGWTVDRGLQFTGVTTPEGAWKTALTLFLAHGYVGKDHLRNSSGRYVWIDSNLAERSRLPLPLSLDGNISAGAVANILWHFGRRLGNFQNGTDSVGFEIIIEFLQNDFRPPGRDVTLRDFMDSWACARPDDLGNIQSALAEYEIPYAAPLCQQ